MISQPCSIDINTAWFNRAVMDLRPVNTARLVCKQSSIEKYWFPNLHVNFFLLNRNDPFCVTPSKIVVYNRWKMRTKTITIQQLLPGLAWGEMSVEIALPTVYSSCECLSPCWCHFSLQDLPRKECQFRYCTEHETFSLLNGNQTRWRLFSFDFWIWNEGLLIGWI